MDFIEVYTDGSIVDNSFDFVGYGWAYIIPELNVSASGKTFETTNSSSRMELTAIVHALRYIAEHKGNYLIYCDSEATVRCFKGLGARKLYKDLWGEVHKLMKKTHSAGSKVGITFLDRKALDKNGQTFKYAQEVDHLAYVQANSLETL